MGTKKENICKSLLVFSNNNQVYLTGTNLNEVDWSPINFHWIPIKKLQEELNYMTPNDEN